jgi:ABC-type nitrate/sulfonate/bicarbonate transport system substrate-binding protein
VFSDLFAEPFYAGAAGAFAKRGFNVNAISLNNAGAVAAAIGGGSLEMGCGDLISALLSEPFVTIDKGSIRAVGHPFDAAADHAVGKQFCVSVWYASKTWIDQDRERARNAVAAINETAQWANTHHAETLAILLRNGKLDAGKVQDMQRVAFATSLTPDIVQPVLDIANQQKVFSRPVNAKALITQV